MEDSLFTYSDQRKRVKGHRCLVITAFLKQHFIIHPPCTALMCRTDHSASYKNTFYERDRVLEKVFASHLGVSCFWLFFWKFMCLIVRKMAMWRQIQGLTIIFPFALCFFQLSRPYYHLEMSWKCLHLLDYEKLQKVMSGSLIICSFVLSLWSLVILFSVFVLVFYLLRHCLIP